MNLKYLINITNNYLNFNIIKIYNIKKNLRKNINKKIFYLTAK